MKLFLTLAAAASLSFSAVAGELPSLKQGDLVELKLAGGGGDLPAGALKVLEVGPGTWVQVEYDRTFSKAGESGLQKERARVWVNFAHAVTCRVLPLK